MAGLVGAPLCEKNKKEAVEVNFRAIKNCVQNLKIKIIFLMSNSGYGVGKQNEYCDENSPLNPILYMVKQNVMLKKRLLKLRTMFVLG